MARWKSNRARHRYSIWEGISMGIQKMILTIMLHIVDVLTFFVKRKENRILFVSLTQDHLSSDFKFIHDALEKSGKYDIRCNLLMIEQSLWGSFKYFINCLQQLVQYKQATLVILNDNNYVISTHKPKGCQVLQIWHACGAVKKFGNEIFRRYPIQNYDYAICNAEYWKDVYHRSFDVNKESIYVTGMPRTDALYNDRSEEFFAKYPMCRGKKIALYAPTFRGNIIDGFEVDSFDIKMVEESLEDWVILYKFHPLLGDVSFPQCQSINVNQEDLYMCMQVSDCLISDYSSVIFDYSLLHKPIIEYIDDLRSYESQIGLNIDLEEITNHICENEEELIACLKHLQPDDKVYSFQEKYMKYTDGKNTERVVARIDEIMDK